MTSSQVNREQLNTAADVIGQRVADAEAPVGEGTLDQVEMLKAAGILNETIAQLLRAEGAEEADVTGYVGELGTEPRQTELIWNTHCVGTCMSITLTITYGRRRRS